MSAQPQSSLRLLAPAALAVFAIVFLIVVIASLGGGDETSNSERPTAASTPEQTSSEARQRRRARARAQRLRKARFYTVRAGDTLNLIAARTGVSLAELRTLNPSLDPQGLVTGQRVRLRASGSTGATGATGATGSTGSTGAQGAAETQGGIE